MDSKARRHGHYILYLCCSAGSMIRRQSFSHTGPKMHVVCSGSWDTRRMFPWTRASERCVSTTMQSIGLKLSRQLGRQSIALDVGCLHMHVCGWLCITIGKNLAACVKGRRPGCGGKAMQAPAAERRARTPKMFKPRQRAQTAICASRCPICLLSASTGCCWPCTRQLIAASICQSNPGMMFSATNTRALGVPLTDRQRQLKAIRCSRSRAPAPRVAAVAQRSEGSRKRFLDLSRQKLVPARLLSCTHGSTVSLPLLKTPFAGCCRCAECLTGALTPPNVHIDLTQAFRKMGLHQSYHCCEAVVGSNLL